MLTRILASSVRTIPWTLWSPFLSFFYNGGILCACDGLTKIHKSYGGGGGGVQLYIYLGPYEIRFNFSIFLDSVFSIFILWTPF